MTKEKAALAPMAARIALPSDARTRLPLVYADAYNITFYGLENCHPFDSKKYKRVVGFLRAWGLLDAAPMIDVPRELTDAELEMEHTAAYVQQLRSSKSLAAIVEMPFLRMFRNATAYNHVARPMSFASHGSILAALCSLQRGFAINLGGGFHHACGYRGGGFCAIADIALIVRFLRNADAKFRRVMVVDLDAHQGNGHERSFLNDHDIYIMDVFNEQIYPGDTAAKAAINCSVPIQCGTADDEYLPLVESNLATSFSEFGAPDLVIYNAGTDILEGDPLGQLDVSEEGVIRRDELVFQACISRRVPVVMLLSGGYQKSNAEVIASSIRNLHAKFNLLAPPNSIASAISNADAIAAAALPTDDTDDADDAPGALP